MVRYDLASRSVEITYLGFYIKNESLFFDFKALSFSNSVFNDLDERSMAHAIDFLDNLILKVRDEFKNLDNSFVLTKDKDNQFLIEILNDTKVNSNDDEADYNRFILIKDVVNYINNACELEIKDYYQNQRWFGKIDKSLDIK